MTDIGRGGALLEENLQQFQLVDFTASKENCCGHEIKENKWEGGENEDLKANVERDMVTCDNEAILGLLYVTGSFMKQKTSTNTVMSAMQVYTQPSPAFVT